MAEPAQERIVGVRRGPRGTRPADRRLGPEPVRKFRSNLPRDVVFDRQIAVSASLVAIAPKDHVIGGVQESRGNPQTISSALHRASHHHVNAKLTCDLRKPLRPAAILKRSARRNHTGAFDLTEFAGHCLGQAVCKVGVHVADGRERQHRHRAAHAACRRSGQRPFFTLEHDNRDDRRGDDRRGGQRRHAPGDRAATPRGLDRRRWRQQRKVRGGIGHGMRQVGRRSVSPARILRKTSCDDARQRHRHISTDRREVTRFVAQNRRRQFSHRRAAERTCTGEHLVDQRSKGELIGPMIDVASFKLLRRHVRGRADDSSRVRHRGLRNCGG